jgi:bifunctional DNA-binding transcriptional regulator/antitoxin component of YhaV-PrlF toxin-antitoxin module
MGVTTKLERGAIVLPDELRAELGWSDGVEILAVVEDGELRLQRTDLPEPELYTLERQAEFFLNNAIGEADYAWAIEQVRRMGLDSVTIPHDGTAKWATYGR